MSHRLSRIALAAWSAVAAGSLTSPSAHAQGVASEQQLQAVTVTGTALRSPLDPNLPSTTASKTAEQLKREQNLFNPEDALQYMHRTPPSANATCGDRNALIAGRSFGTLTGPRARWC